MSAPNWQDTRVAPEGTHHLWRGRPLYGMRFREVLKFHAPGLAPVRDESGAFHIGVSGTPAYADRHVRTFGFYEDLAAVENVDGWIHIHPDGSSLYTQRYDWCGNYQGCRCPVRTKDGGYLHLDERGAPAYPARYMYAGDYRDGIAVVQNDQGLHTHIDREGRLLHGRWFDDLDVFHKGLARARDVGGWHHVNEFGEAVYARRFSAVEPFYNGQARVGTHAGGLQVIAEDGAILTELRSERRTPLQRLSSDMVGFWRTRTIEAGVGLGIFAILPASTEAVAAATKLSRDHAFRVLRGLWELGLVEPNNGRGWDATETGALLGQKVDGGMDAAANMWGGTHYTTWRHLEEILRGGDSIRRIDYFDSLRHQELATYHRALAAYAREDFKDLPVVIDWSQHRRILDAGGATGTLLFHLLDAVPHLHGTVMDRPEVIEMVHIPPPLRDRVQCSGFDLFSPWPQEADAIIMSRVLHDWDDERGAIILAQARACLTDGGRIYIIEMVLSEDHPKGALADLNLLVMTGGRERNIEDWRRLFAGVGMALEQVLPLNEVASILVVTPL